MDTDASIPNPATPAAKALGCTCPTQGGRGHRVRMNCPVHGVKLELRDKTSAERKGEPIHSGVLMYFPDALAAIARWSLIGNIKHNGPDAPLGWSRGKSMDQMDCLIRHSLTKDAMDGDEAEGVAMAWRALAQLQLDEERRLVAKGIRPYSGITP